MPSIKIDKDKIKIQMIYAKIQDYNQLAEAASISRRTIGNILSENHNWNINQLVRIASALNCNPLDLITIEGFPDPKASALASA